MEKAVLVEKFKKITLIKLNNPENLNALNMQMGDELVKAMADAGGDPAVRAVIVTGSGRAFCSGGDLQFFSNWEGPKHEAFGVLTHRLHRIILDIRQMPKPVIAAVNGTASGAGFSLAMACDLRIASDKAKFKQAYSSMGLVPDGGWTITLARQIGMAKATELLLLDPVLKADELLNLGLLNEVVPEVELLNRAMQLADLVTTKSQTAFAKGKALLNRALFFDLAEQLELERQCIMAAADEPDFAEGLTAFTEKRVPRF